MSKVVQYLFLLCFLTINACHVQKTEKAKTPEDVVDLNALIIDYHAYLDSNSEFRKTNWEDFSDSLIYNRKSAVQNLLQVSDGIDRSILNEDQLINLEMIDYFLKDEQFNLDFESHLFPLNAEGGFLTEMVYETQSKNISNKEDADNYLEKLNRVPSFIDRKIELMKRGIEQNKIHPKVIVENCLAILDQQINVEIEDSHFYQPFKTNKDYQEKGRELIESTVLPSLQKFEDFLEEEYHVHALDEVGISNISNGKEYYEQRVKFFSTLDMSPKEIFDIGQAEVERIRSEMEAIISDLKFEGSFADFLEFLRTDSQFYAETPGELLNHAAWYSKKAEEILPKYFGKIPRLPFTVKAVPAAIAPTYTTGRYSGGSFKDGRAGQYWVNTYNLESRPLYVLPSLTLHEAVPGHHMQISLAQEMEDVPKFRTRAYLSAFGEGWALYCEYLGKEAGIYTTAYEDFGRLTYEMWRACRLVVDPGMHYFDWTREEAIDFMKKNTSLSLHEVTTEVDRYIGWPGQAVSYKIGELKIRELRKLAEESLGENFEIKEFHDLILQNGAIPLQAMDRIVREYISEKSQGK